MIKKIKQFLKWIWKMVKAFFGWPVRVAKYFSSDQWGYADKLPYRWWFSSQGKAVVTAVILCIVIFANAGNPDNFHVLLGALVMRILSIPRFH